MDEASSRRLRKNKSDLRRHLKKKVLECIQDTVSQETACFMPSISIQTPFLNIFDGSANQAISGPGKTHGKDGPVVLHGLAIGSLRPGPSCTAR